MARSARINTIASVLSVLPGLMLGSTSVSLEGAGDEDYQFSRGDVAGPHARGREEVPNLRAQHIG